VFHETARDMEHEGDIKLETKLWDETSTITEIQCIPTKPNFNSFQALGCY